MRASLFAGLAVAALGLAPAFAQDASRYDRYGYGHMGWDGGGWSMMIFGPFLMILTLVVLIAAIVLVARWLGVSGQGGNLLASPGKGPLDILKERYARGEIDKAEFEERRRVLQD